MKRKKNKISVCKHENSKIETTYIRVSDKPIDGYKSMNMVSCKNCNIMLNLIKQKEEDSNG